MAIFVTWDKVIRILDDPAQSPAMGAVAEMIGRMDTQQLQRVQLMLQGM